MNEKWMGCPACGSRIPVISGYSSWCDHCHFNLNPAQEQKKKTLLGKAYEALGRKNGEQMLYKLIKSSAQKPSITAQGVIAYFLAALVHLLSLGLAAAAGYLVWVGSDKVFLLFTAVLLLGISWVARPKIDRLEKDETVLTREDLPEFFRLVDSITSELGTGKIDGVVLNGEFNASIGRYGWKKRIIIKMGLPLFSILTAEEKKALLAHEIGHLANGDLARGFFIGTALNTLEVWHEILEPEELHEGQSGDLVKMVSASILKALSFFPKTYSDLLLYFLYFNKQQAEYFADYTGARLAGTEPAITLLEKIEYGRLYEYSIRKTALSSEKLNLYHCLNDEIKQLPKREKSRYRKIAELEKSKVDDTHPPTYFRVQYLQSKKHLQKQADVDLQQFKSIQQELFCFENAIQNAVTEEYWYYHS
ncbi:M48 family metallopeptidase [Jeotgalibacillus sp. ET6]|uniref:M48 family metallopeptidase n=1 Tax=Jeotgalibacillus sp. ET6 TaxID=3037260 RepID=UPI0024188778|nr:M48 family metallopeptidase [Jeotgalibacillus sp. ET6]MDG5472668.1 M48 family metallopeptidase [Jeotgalibacillus sp. ET6]